MLTCVHPRSAKHKRARKKQIPTIVYSKASETKGPERSPQEVAANVGRWEPETRINSLQTAVSARRLGVNGGEEGPRRVTATPRPPRGHPEAIWWLTGRHPEATLRLPRGYPEATPRLPRGYPEATPVWLRCQWRRCNCVRPSAGTFIECSAFVCIINCKRPIRHWKEGAASWRYSARCELRVR